MYAARLYVLLFDARVISGEAIHLLRMAMIASMLALMSKRFLCALDTRSFTSEMNASFSSLDDFHTSDFNPRSSTLSIAIMSDFSSGFSTSSILRSISLYMFWMSVRLAVCTRKISTCL